jgi:mono/diheme cytochrome c family protein
MRERWARVLATFTALLLLFLAAMFANYQRSVRNASTAMGTHSVVIPIDPQASKSQIARGRTLFAEMQCDSCHSIRGRGNPRFPLDEAARTLDRSTLRRRALGTDPAAPVAARILRRKSANQQRSEVDLDTVISYLIDDGNGTAN